MKDKERNDKELKKLIEKTIEKNLLALQSLKDYDEGKKEISIDKLKRDFPNIRTSH